MLTEFNEGNNKEDKGYIQKDAKQTPNQQCYQADAT
jgi:hypothetical protein